MSCEVISLESDPANDYTGKISLFPLHQGQASRVVVCACVYMLPYGVSVVGLWLCAWFLHWCMGNLLSVVHTGVWVDISMQVFHRPLLTPVWVNPDSRCLIQIICLILNLVRLLKSKGSAGQKHNNVSRSINNKLFSTTVLCPLKVVMKSYPNLNLCLCGCVWVGCLHACAVSLLLCPSHTPHCISFIYPY